MVKILKFLSGKFGAMSEDGQLLVYEENGQPPVKFAYNFQSTENAKRTHEFSSVEKVKKLIGISSKIEKGIRYQVVDTMDDAEIQQLRMLTLHYCFLHPNGEPDSAMFKLMIDRDEYKLALQNPKGFNKSKTFMAAIKHRHSDETYPAHIAIFGSMGFITQEVIETRPTGLNYDFQDARYERPFAALLR